MQRVNSIPFAVSIGIRRFRPLPFASCTTRKRFGTQAIRSLASSTTSTSMTLSAKLPSSEASAPAARCAKKCNAQITSHSCWMWWDQRTAQALAFSLFKDFSFSFAASAMSLLWSAGTSTICLTAAISSCPYSQSTASVTPSTRSRRAK